MSESLKDLSLFTTVVERGGFANAAAPLDLTPSAVSKAVARLEERLGARLFTRSTRTIKLTEAGQELYHRAQGILAAVSEAEAVVGNLSQQPQGDLRVSCSDAFATLILVPMLKTFSLEFPDIRVHVIQGDGPLDLLKEDYDVAIRFEAPEQKGLKVTTLTDDPWVVCASRDYLTAHGQPKSPRDLKEHRCLAIRAREKLDDTWLFKGGQRNSVRISPVFSGIGMVVKNAAIEGLGIARLANFLVKDAIQSGELVSLLESEQIKGQRKIYGVTQDRKYTPAKTEVFLTALTNYLAVS